MPMISLRMFRLGLKSLALHKLRSTLTLIGIVLGVASVIIMVAVGEAARFQAVEQIKQLGATNIIIRSVKPEAAREQTGRTFVLSYGLTSADLKRIVDTIPCVVSATPIREFRRKVRYLDRMLEGRVVAVTPEYQHMNGLRLSRGRFITALDLEQYANVAVLGSETAEKLFPLEDPIGKSIRIDESQYFRVVGVTEYRAPTAAIGTSLSAQDYNRDVYIPFTTDRVRFGEVIVYRRAGTLQREKLEISQITVSVDAMEHVKQTARIIDGLLQKYHEQEDTTITVPLDLLERAEETQRTFTLVLGAIASISLVVGGIGIMNIMLATVTERTREIGVRRAMGANRWDITYQFLIETVVLSSAGGLLGIALGIAASYQVARYIELPAMIPPWAPLMAWTISVVVGVIFGIYPARRAATMDPIEALRHE